MIASLESREQAFAEFTATRETLGVRAALAGLLRRSDYRYIAIFRFEHGRANAAVFYDRDDPAALTTDEVPDTATYCCYVRDGAGVFMTADAMLDPRTAGHPARTTVPAYCGVPIMDEEGRVFGTLCHYDVVPRDPSQLDLALLSAVASALARGNHVPPYPTPRRP